MNGMSWAEPDWDEEITGSNEWPTSSGWDPLWLRQANRRSKKVVNIERNRHHTQVSGLLQQTALNPQNGLGFSTRTVNGGNPAENTIQMTTITRKDHKRHDAFTAYIDEAPASVKDKITVFAGPQYRANRVLMEAGVDPLAGESRLKARGVETGSGVLCAEKGVVVAAGALWSPALLEQSGLGTTANVQPLGYPSAIVENNQIGENLQDHLQTFRTFVIPPGIPGVPNPI